MGIIMYADDILLLSPTILGLQSMLDQCTQSLTKKCLEFNVKKCTCMALGKAAKYTLSPMMLQDSHIEWAKTFKYLGITFQAGKSLKADINVTKRKFYSSCNRILSKTANINEITRLHLLESNCLPILTYAISVLNLNEEQIREMNVAWNSVYRKIFGFHQWESVSVFIAGLGKLNFRHNWLKLCVTFIKDNLDSSNNTVRYMLLRNVISHFRTFCDKHDLLIDRNLFLTRQFSHGQVVAAVFNSYRRVTEKRQ